jgi:hypothetical protein
MNILLASLWWRTKVCRSLSFVLQDIREIWLAIPSYMRYDWLSSRMHYEVDFWEQRGACLYNFIALWFHEIMIAATHLYYIKNGCAYDELSHRQHNQEPSSHCYSLWSGAVVSVISVLSHMGRSSFFIFFSVGFFTITTDCAIFFFVFQWRDSGRQELWRYPNRLLYLKARYNTI